MSAASVTLSEAYTQRYEALLRATNAIGTCSDCETAGDQLVKALREVVPFDYLEVIAFENDTDRVEWHLLFSNGRRQEPPSPEHAVEDSPITWAHQAQQRLVISDWAVETRFLQHRELLQQYGIRSTCSLPLRRGDRRLGVFSVGNNRP
jgi:GAF domain-containing protein